MNVHNIVTEHANSKNRVSLLCKWPGEKQTLKQKNDFIPPAHHPPPSEPTCSETGSHQMAGAKPELLPDTPGDE